MTTSLVTLKPTSADGQRVLLMDWRLAAGRLPAPPASVLPEVYSRLTPVERATVRVLAPSLANLPLRVGILGEAAARLCAFGDRGVLASMSGQQIARSLHYTLVGIHPLALRRARKGWSILAAMDAADLGVEVWISGAPTVDDPRHYRRMRLHERIAELDTTGRSK